MESCIRCDAGKFRQAERMFEEHDFDYVYHAAAEYGRRNGEDYYENHWLTNVIDAKNVLSMQERRKLVKSLGSVELVSGDARRGSEGEPEDSLRESPRLFTSLEDRQGSSKEESERVYCRGSHAPLLIPRHRKGYQVCRQGFSMVSSMNVIICAGSNTGAGVWSH